MFYWNAREKSDGEKNRDEENDECTVGGEEEFAEGQKDGDAHVADGVSHGGTDADGGEVHDEVGEAEHNLSEGFGEV